MSKWTAKSPASFRQEGFNSHWEVRQFTTEKFSLVEAHFWKSCTEYLRDPFQVVHFIVSPRLEEFGASLQDVEPAPSVRRNFEQISKKWRSVFGLFYTEIKYYTSITNRKVYNVPSRQSSHLLWLIEDMYPWSSVINPCLNI